MNIQTFHLPILPLLTLSLAVVTTGCTKGKLINSHNALVPAVTRVLPESATIQGGTEIQVFGTGFVNGAVILLGDTACVNTQYVSDTLLTCTTPAHTVARVDVSVTNPNSKSGSLAAGFAFVAPPSNGPGSIPGFAITSGGGVTQGAARRAISTIGELGSPRVQTGAHRMLVGGLQ